MSNIVCGPFSFEERGAIYTMRHDDAMMAGGNGDSKYVLAGAAGGEAINPG
jgi:hypothetical protein